MMLTHFSSWTLQIIGTGGPGTYFNLVGVTPHMMGTRTINWLAIIFLPLAATAFDLSGKVFSNMFYPTQTQIHIEMEAKEVAEKRRAERQAARGGQEFGGVSTITASV
jgi:hypothetical protein